MTIEEIKQSLIKIQGYARYSDKIINQFMNDIEAMSPEIRQALEEFLQTGKKSDLVREGHSWKSLQDLGMKPIGAFFTLSWLEKEPKAAKQALKQGYDTIIFDKDDIKPLLANK